MKKIFSINEASDTTNLALLITRIGISALMLTHGLPKLMLLLSGASIRFPTVLGMTSELSLGLAVIAEVGCSILILAGFATRLAVVPLILTMFYAAFIVHAADPFAKQEPALQYILVYTVLFLAGSGKFSVDYLLEGKRSTGKTASRQR